VSLKPHICKISGYGKVWYAFRGRAHRDKCVEELRLGVSESKRRHDASTWGLTFTDALRRALLQ
jgi:hypothetical protein